MVFILLGRTDHGDGFLSLCIAKPSWLHHGPVHGPSCVDGMVGYIPMEEETPCVDGHGRDGDGCASSAHVQRFLAHPRRKDVRADGQRTEGRDGREANDVTCAVGTWKVLWNRG